MKKIILLLTATALFIACSNRDDNGTVEGNARNLDEAFTQVGICWDCKYVARFYDLPTNYVFKNEGQFKDTINFKKPRVTRVAFKKPDEIFETYRNRVGKQTLKFNKIGIDPKRFNSTTVYLNAIEKNKDTDVTRFLEGTSKTSGISVKNDVVFMLHYSKDIPKEDDPFAGDGTEQGEIIFLDRIR